VIFFYLLTFFDSLHIFMGNRLKMMSQFHKLLSYWKQNSLAILPSFNETIVDCGRQCGGFMIDS